MKVKLFILTWNDSESLNNNLASLFQVFRYDLTGIDFHVNIINNHTNFSIDPVYATQVNIIHNRATPDFATAMVARMWNTALIHGFKNLNSTDSDIVITSQDDTVWHPDWLLKLIKIHETYSFYAGDAGDMVCSYTPEAVKKIGLWDERFHYGFGEGDYFLRAIRFNGDRSSINDHAHGRVWNASEQVAFRPEPDTMRYSEQSRSHNYRGLSWAIFLHKWKHFELEGKWPNNIHERVMESEMPQQFINYPYFEMDVENLKEKGFLVP